MAIHQYRWASFLTTNVHSNNANALLWYKSLSPSVQTYFALENGANSCVCYPLCPKLLTQTLEFIRNAIFVG